MLNILALSERLNNGCIQQGARLLRVLRLPILKEFFYRVIGNGSRFLMVIFTVLLFLCCFAILSVQVFGYLPTEPECEDTGESQFVNFIEVSLFLPSHISPPLSFSSSLHHYVSFIPPPSLLSFLAVSYWRVDMLSHSLP